MTMKPFEIQSSGLVLGGVQLEAGNTGVVIPGVTQATSYKVEEVNDTTDQTYNGFPADTEGAVVVIDAALYSAIVQQIDESHFADFTVTTDGEGYIDEIQVNGQGTYSSAESSSAGGSDMYAYIGAGSASDRPLVPEDWMTIPFRPKMRAGDVENISGGGSSLTVASMNGPSVENVSTLVLGTGGSLTELDSGVVGITFSSSISSGAGTFSTLPDFLDFSPNTSLHAGQTADGVFFSGNATGADASYPVRTNFTIAGNTKVVVTVDMIINDNCSDFGLCVFEDGIEPQWVWGTNDSRIAAQFDCLLPSLAGISGGIDAEQELPGNGTYTVRFTYDPNNEPSVTFEVLDTNSTVITTLTNNDTLNTNNSYRIGFAADQDATELRTYIKNLTVAVDGGATYTNSLMLAGGGVTSYNDLTDKPIIPTAEPERSWVNILGDGYNSAPHYEDNNSNDLWFDVVVPGPDGTVFAGGGWGYGYNSIVYQYDKHGKVLWRWQDSDNTDSVSAIAYDDTNNQLYVAVPSYYDGRNYHGTRLHVFSKPIPVQGDPYSRIEWVHSDTQTLHDANDNGDLTINDLGVRNGNWYAVGEKTGTFVVAGTDISAAPGTTAGGIVNILKSAITPQGGLYPDTSNSWHIKTINDGGATLNRDINSELGQFSINAGDWTTNGNGIDAAFQVQVDYNTGNYNVNVANSGSGFANGDLVTIKGSKLYGIDTISYTFNSGANSSGGGTSTLHFDITTYPSLDSQVLAGYRANGPGISNANVISVTQVTYPDATVWDVVIDQQGAGLGDFVFDNRGNDLTFNVAVYFYDPNASYIWYLTNIAGTADTTVLRFNYDGWNLTSDFTDPAFRFEITYSTSSDGFIYTNADEFSKVQSGPNWGRYQAVAYNSTTSSYYVVGGADRSGDTTLISKWNNSGSVDWTLSGTDTDAIYGVATNGTDKVFTYSNANGTILALNSTTGSKIWESRMDWNSIPLGIDNNNVQLVYHGGYLYVGSLFGSMWSNGNVGVLIEKIDPNTGLGVWARTIHSDKDNWRTYYEWAGKWFTVTDTGCYVVGYSYFKTDYYDNAAIAKIPLDGGVAYEVFGNGGPAALPQDIDNEFKIYGKMNNADFATFRISVDETTLSARTDLEVQDSDFGTGSTSYNDGFPYFVDCLTNLTSGVQDHDPTVVPQSNPGWYDNNNYYLKLDDAGKFIRSTWEYNSNMYVYVPSDSIVDFPIGTIITLVNMWDWNDNSNYIYIQSDNSYQDNFGNGARVYLAGQGTGYSPQWGLKGRGSATLMKVGPNEWLLTGSNIDNTW